MFDALKGLKEALAAKERILEERKILAADAIEELNRILTGLEKGTMITVAVRICGVVGLKEKYLSGIS